MTIDNLTIEESATGADNFEPLPDNVVPFPIGHKAPTRNRIIETPIEDHLPKPSVAQVIEFPRKRSKPRHRSTFPPPPYLGSKNWMTPGAHIPDA